MYYFVRMRRVVLTVDTNDVCESEQINQSISIVSKVKKT